MSEVETLSHAVMCFYKLKVVHGILILLANRHLQHNMNTVRSVKGLGKPIGQESFEHCLPWSCRVLRRPHDVSVSSGQFEKSPKKEVRHDHYETCAFAGAC